MLTFPYVTALGTLRSQVVTGGIKPLGAVTYHTKWQWSSPLVRSSTENFEREQKRQYHRPVLELNLPYHKHLISPQGRSSSPSISRRSSTYLDIFLSDTVYLSGGKEIRLVHRPPSEPAPHNILLGQRGVRPQRSDEDLDATTTAVPTRTGSRTSGNSEKSTS